MISSKAAIVLRGLEAGRVGLRQIHALEQKLDKARGWRPPCPAMVWATRETREDYWDKYAAIEAVAEQRVAGSDELMRFKNLGVDFRFVAREDGMAGLDRLAAADWSIDVQPKVALLEQFGASPDSIAHLFSLHSQAILGTPLSEVRPAVTSLQAVLRLDKAEFDRLCPLAPAWLLPPERMSENYSLLTKEVGFLRDEVLELMLRHASDLLGFPGIAAGWRALSALRPEFEEEELRTLVRNEPSVLFNGLPGAVIKIIMLECKYSKKEILASPIRIERADLRCDDDEFIYERLDLLRQRRKFHLVTDRRHLNYISPSTLVGDLHYVRYKMKRKPNTIFGPS